jgi:hypothetical protein
MLPRTLAIDDYGAVLFTDQVPKTIYFWQAGGSARYLNTDYLSAFESSLSAVTTILADEPL